MYLRGRTLTKRKSRFFLRFGPHLPSRRYSQCLESDRGAEEVHFWPHKSGHGTGVTLMRTHRCGLVRIDVPRGTPKCWFDVLEFSPNREPAARHQRASVRKIPHQRVGVGACEEQGKRPRDGRRGRSVAALSTRGVVGVRASGRRPALPLGLPPSTVGDRGRLVLPPPVARSLGSEVAHRRRAARHMPRAPGRDTRCVGG